MRDPFTWSLPLGRMFGVPVRAHVLFPFVAVALLLRVALNVQKAPGDAGFPPGAWVDMATILVLLFVSVLFHEGGHCLGARLVDGDTHEILIWPLGGLAAVDVPHTPRANFIATAMGPAVNLGFCLIAGLLFLTLTGFEFRPPINPFSWPIRPDGDQLIQLYTWRDVPASLANPTVVNEPWVVFLARLFWVNWVLFFLNVVLLGYPLDGGRLFQSILWKYVGYRQATLAAVFAGFITMFVVGLYAIIQEQVLALCLAIFIYVSCRQQWIILETGSEEGVFGYDFSQGYTSLERDQPAQPRPRRPGWWQRWRQRRAARKLQREIEQREYEERRTDELLDKISREGKNALTDEEQRFLKRVSDRYRNRH